MAARSLPGAFPKPGSLSLRYQAPWAARFPLTSPVMATGLGALSVAHAGFECRIPRGPTVSGDRLFIFADARTIARYVYERGTVYKALDHVLDFTNQRGNLIIPARSADDLEIQLSINPPALQVPSIRRSYFQLNDLLARDIALQLADIDEVRLSGINIVSLCFVGFFFFSPPIYPA